MNTKFLAEMDNTAYALQLAAYGWHVFPCWHVQGPHEKNTVKSPIAQLAPHWPNDATTDQDKVYSWWKQAPNALVGIACEKSGLIVIDPDRHEGKPDGVAAFAEMLEKNGPIVYGPSQTTPNNGQHLIFKAPKFPDNFIIPDELAPGIDIKYHGYVCTGRLLDGRRYEWLEDHSFDTPLTYPPAWVCKMIVQHHEQQTKSMEPVKRKAKTGALLPGDDFAARVDWFDALLLGGIGWRRAGAKGEKTYLTRPGKQAGVSATLNYSGKDNLYIFSTNASPFQPKKSYSKFAAYALLKHGGDFTTAARALAAAGYGTQNSSTGSTK